ncbi:MAG: stage II sporulation protein M [archaeon]
MVLESIISGKNARNHPLVMMFLAAALSSVGIWTSYLTFPSSASVLSIAFITIGIVPILYTIFIVEEAEEASKEGKWFSFISRHFDLIKIYSWFFIGLILSYSLWYVVLPPEMNATVFSEQNTVIENISELKTELTGNITGTTAVCSDNLWCWFDVILQNNLRVLFLGVILSAVYGVGAMFLIAWNASVIGAVIGKDALMLVSSYASFGAFAYVFAYFHGLIKALGLIPHGMFEVLGYFVGAMAGALISIVVTKGHYRKHEIKLLVKDSIGLIFLSLLLLFIGAVIEAALIVG